MDFETMVRRGLGRAVIYAREHDISGHREFLLNACLHNIAYDPQIEWTRSEYMYDIIRASNDLEFYASQIREALEHIEEEENPSTQLEIASWLGWAGDEKMRQSLRSLLVKYPASDFSRDVAEEIAKMDGVEGLIFVFETLVMEELDDAPTGPSCQLGMMLDDVIESEGEDETRTALDKAVLENPSLAPVVETAYKIQIARKGLPFSHVPQRIPTNYDEIKAAISGSTNLRCYPMLLNSWGMAIDDATALRLAQDLLEETDVKRLRLYLGLFGERPFPLPYQKLFDLTVYPDADSWRTYPESRLVWPAYAALAQITAPDVRALALDLIASDEKPYFGVELLLGNYQDGDWKMLTELVERDLSVDAVYWTTFEANALFQKYPSPDATEMFLVLYEKCPSISGRLYYVIDNIRTLGPLPDWMVEECRYDAYECTRALVSELS